MYFFRIFYFILFFLFFFSGILILGVRLELFNIFLNIFQNDYFNSLTTLHGLIMIFGFITPCFTGLFYMILPNIIFIKNFFFFKISIFSFLMLFFSSIFLIFSFFLPFGNFSFGWTLYTPLSLQSNYNLDFIIFSIYFFSISFLISSLNLSLTILNNFRFSIFKMPIILWVILISSYLNIIILPVLIGLVTMLIFDKYFKTSFFNPVLNGDTILYQHIFWFFGHPEVYVIILPSFGIVSQIVSIFSKKKIFSYFSIIYALLIISTISLIVWGHHMYSLGSSFLLSSFFMYCTMLISIPTGIKIFNWFFTIWRGFIYFDTPFLFCLGFFYFFIIGGFSGIILSSIPLDLFYHGTYFVVAHFHFILVSSTIFSIYSFFYYWSPLLFNIKYNEFLSKLHFWFSFIFLNFSFFPMHFLGFKGMPRRYIDFPKIYLFYNKFISISSILFGFSQLYFFYYIFYPLICY
ncbi:cbb3-type cytochrome c oxidase subunit I [Candidatus Nasuia deltocephalinicola]|nr:cbb3-type cytochrome c oxidase subunit I [Candidatus Nasuia deltocephalinicola]